MLMDNVEVVVFVQHNQLIIRYFCDIFGGVLKIGSYHRSFINTKQKPQLSYRKATRHFHFTKKSW